MNHISQIDHDGRTSCAPEVNCELEVDLLDRQSDVIAVIPPTYVAEHTSKIMDIIEKLERVIGVKRCV